MCATVCATATYQLCINSYPFEAPSCEAFSAFERCVGPACMTDASTQPSIEALKGELKTWGIHCSVANTHAHVRPVTPSPTVTFSCQPTEWGPCSLTCSTAGELGSMSRTGLCLSSDGFVAHPRHCPGCITSTTDLCTPPVCPTVAPPQGPAPGQHPRSPAPVRRQCSYRTNPWSPCSATCGSGIRIRSLDCVCNTDIAAAPPECAAALKPAEREPCAEERCQLQLTDPPTYQPTIPVPVSVAPTLASICTPGASFQCK